MVKTCPHRFSDDKISIVEMMRDLFEIKENTVKNKENDINHHPTVCGHVWNKIGPLIRIVLSCSALFAVLSLATVKETQSDAN